VPVNPVGPSAVGPLIPHEQGAALPVPSVDDEGSKSFGQFLTEAIGDVNALQQNAGQMVERYAAGERMDIHQVMIALEQASTALALTVQVRNKLVEAYQEIMRTQV
jgi:flagellar hook-basal body complex protein FliE